MDHSGVLIYKTVSYRLVTREQPREMGFMGFYWVKIRLSFVFLEPKTISINFFYFLKLEEKKIKELLIKVFGPEKTEDS